MKNLFNVIAILLSAMSLTGCLSGIKSLRSDASVELQQDTVIVFRMQTNDFPRTKLVINSFAYEADTGYIYRDASNLFFAKLVSDKEGYFVLKVPQLEADRMYAVMLVAAKFDNNSEYYPPGYWCHNQEYFAFEATHPGMYYLGDISLSINDHDYSYTKTYKIEETKNYLATKFPKLDTTNIQQSELRSMQRKGMVGKVKESCYITQQVYISI